MPTKLARASIGAAVYPAHLNSTHSTGEFIHTPPSASLTTIIRVGKGNPKHLTVGPPTIQIDSDERRKHIRVVHLEIHAAPVGVEHVATRNNSEQFAACAIHDRQ